MNDPGYEPLLDSKWAIPFVAMLILVAMAGLALLRIGLLISKKGATKRAAMALARPGPADTVEGIPAG